MSQNNISKKQVILYAVTATLIIAAIIALKIRTGQSASGDCPSPGKAVPANIARPDTTLTETAIPEQPDTTPAAATDLVGRDTRQAAEAGAEDGYWNGYHDGAAGNDDRNEYDETSDFPTAAERTRYAENYREGYERGYREGRSGARPDETED